MKKLIGLSRKALNELKKLIRMICLDIWQNEGFDDYPELNPVIDWDIINYDNGELTLHVSYGYESKYYQSNGEKVYKIPASQLEQSDSFSIYVDLFNYSRFMTLCIKYESGQASTREILEYFQYLIRTDKYKLKRFKYSGQIDKLIRYGIFDKKGQFNKDKFKKYYK